MILAEVTSRSCMYGLLQDLVTIVWINIVDCEYVLYFHPMVSLVFQSDSLVSLHF
jgi:hypothetical protein